MKKFFCIAGMIVGAFIILLGILAVSGAMGGDTGTASSASYMYDSGYAMFGADFYNYVSNNAAEAASASRTAARNLDEIAWLIKNVVGYGFMAFGLLTICGFGAALAGCGKRSPVQPAAPAPAPYTPEPAPAPYTPAPPVYAPAPEEAAPAVEEDTAQPAPMDGELY